MSTLVKSPESLIKDFHAENYDKSPILSIEWIGDFLFSENESSLYIVTTDTAKYRYTFGIEQKAVLDAELDWD